MVRPDIAPGMKDRHNLAGRRVDTRQVWSLVGVAAVAGESEIVWGVSPAVLLCDDVFDVMREPALFLPEQAVFAAVSGTLADKLSRGGIHQEGPFNPK